MLAAARVKRDSGGKGERVRGIKNAGAPTVIINVGLGSRKFPVAIEANGKQHVQST